jgi:hypothetical protein
MLLGLFLIAGGMAGIAYIDSEPYALIWMGPAAMTMFLAGAALMVRSVRERHRKRIHESVGVLVQSEPVDHVR